MPVHPIRAATLALALLAPLAPLAPVAAAGYAADSYSVVAVIDTGIQPELPAFRDVNRIAHPSTYITGYPTGTPALTTALEGAAADTLYYIEGTRIIGAVSLGQYVPPAQVLCPENRRRVIYDDCGHGTTVSKLVATQSQNILLVMVEVGGGEVEEGIRWALAKPWIDVITVSWGSIGNLPLGTSAAKATREATESGKIVTVAAGNGFSNTAVAPDRSLTYTSPLAGPKWVVTVGAASPETGWDHYWHSVPVDVVAMASATSFSTPIVAGQFARVIASARAAVGDTEEGPRGQDLVVAAEGSWLPERGPFSDGKLSRSELETALLSTASYRPADAPAGPSKPLPTDLPETVYEHVRRCVRDGTSWFSYEPPEGSFPAGLDEKIKSWHWNLYCSLPETGADLPSWESLGGPRGVTRVPVPADPFDRSQPPTPADFLFEGYGIVSSATGTVALDYVRGVSSPPQRGAEEAFTAASDDVRDRLWAEPHNPPGGGICDVDVPLIRCCTTGDEMLFPRLCLDPPSS